MTRAAFVLLLVAGTATRVPPNRVTLSMLGQGDKVCVCRNPIIA